MEREDSSHRPHQRGTHTLYIQTANDILEVHADSVHLYLQIVPAKAEIMLAT